ncbi:MAG TPA: BON domain-containing protein [Longimicrobiaceae bacterium]|nr:BON domain-containing protein [Longimicrobiaceae bacterium]
MWEIRERHDEGDLRQDALTFVLGAAGGFALGLLLSGRVKPAASRARERAGQKVGELRGRADDLRIRAVDLRTRAETIRTRAAGVAAAFRPGRLRRATRDQDELTRLEDAVLDAFLADDVLGERGIDVGAISRGIIELSGSVFTEDEADRAVRLAQRVAGVDTVVNRLDVDDDGHRRGPIPLRDEDAARRETEWTGLNSGMGRRRQGRQTDPDRSDDSRHIQEVSLEHTDRSEFELETGHSRPLGAERSEVQDGKPSKFREDELDNQDPTGPHTRAAPRAPTGPDVNSQSRVGEGPKPGTELRLEAADVPVTPHGDSPRAGGASGEGGEKA